MKKIIVFLFCVMTVLLMVSLNKDSYVIPKDSIRFRIIANSNSLQDQRLKFKINSTLLPKIQEIMTKSNSIEDSRTLISKSLPEIYNEVSKYTNDFNISFGNNYFPEKEYKGVTYEDGEYESLVITLGQGMGDNWWCVMFPPLCLMEAKKNDLDDVTYTTYIKEIINKYL